MGADPKPPHSATLMRKPNNPVRRIIQEHGVYDHSSNSGRSLKHNPESIRHPQLPNLNYAAKRVIPACVWYLDSGCSRHMTGDKSMLTNYVNKFLGTVRFGNDEIATIEGYGDYVFNGVTIKRVSYVRGLGCCLFSVSQFCDSDLRVIFERSMCCVQTMEGDNLLEGKRESTLYSLAMKNMSSDLQALCLVSKASSETSWLWHHRMSHLHSQNLNKLVSNNLVDGVPLISFDSTHAGITHQSSAARTPQQNGVVERRNRTLVESARTMLVYSKLPPSLWAEAVNTACFTQNRSIVNRRFEKIPYELLFNHRPNVKFFRIFGCVCYVLNDKDNLGKFNVRGDEAIFIGYSQDRVAYRVYNRRTRIIKESTNVKFDEMSGMVLGHNCSRPGLNSDPHFRHVPLATSDDLNSSEFLLQDDLDTGVSSSNNTPISNSHPSAVESSPLESSEDTPSNEIDTRSLDAATPPILSTEQNADTLVPLWEENATYPTDNTALSRSSSSSHIVTSLNDGSTSPLLHSTKWTADHPIHQIIGDPDAPVRTRKASNNECLFAAFLSTIEPKTAFEALQDPDWSIAMQEEIH
ncbi:uncharacterized protein [Rutidosis leptorrhynchoides]|uniref:uncharacterized protein n=1 Tax=Rutidosis leptorrhynchoides TaxID=125765 RepID=UPI003A98CFDA